MSRPTRFSTVSPVAVVLLVIIVTALVLAYRSCSGATKGTVEKPPTGEVAVERRSPATGEIVVPFYMKRTGPGGFRYRLYDQEEWLDRLPRRMKDPASGGFFPTDAFPVPAGSGGGDI
jgi:hypothetical protein